MKKSDSISMLKSLISNIENEHIEIMEVKCDEIGLAQVVSLLLHGEPKIGKAEECKVEFSLVEIKAYLRSMFQRQKCGEDVQVENHRLACSYNLLTDANNGIAKFCSDGKADGLKVSDFHSVRF